MCYVSLGPMESRWQDGTRIERKACEMGRKSLKPWCWSASLRTRAGRENKGWGESLGLPCSCEKTLGYTKRVPQGRDCPLEELKMGRHGLALVCPPCSQWLGAAQEECGLGMNVQWLWSGSSWGLSTLCTTGSRLALKETGQGPFRGCHRPNFSFSSCNNPSMQVYVMMCLLVEVNQTRISLAGIQIRENVRVMKKLK